jgi:hypothetical protein
MAEKQGFHVLPSPTHDGSAIVAVHVATAKRLKVARTELGGARTKRGAKRHLDPMANRPPKTDGGEPETSGEALLDELVRALARQMAERDYEALRTKPPRAPNRWRHEGFKMRAAAIYARYSSDLQREGFDRGPEQDLPASAPRRKAGLFIMNTAIVAYRQPA